MRCRGAHHRLVTAARRRWGTTSVRDSPGRGGGEKRGKGRTASIGRGRGLPAFDSSVPAPRDDACAVRAERRAEDRARVALEGEFLLPGFGVPHLHRLVLAPGED